MFHLITKSIVFIFVVQVAVAQWIWEDEDIPTTSSRPLVPPQRPTSSPPTTFTTTTLASVEFTNCMGQCPSLSQYNPVCGTNGNTYRNPEQLTCARNCGINGLDLVHFGQCVGGRPPQPSVSTTSPTVTVTTTQATQQFDSCMRVCPSLPQYNPVCGNNGNTYRNQGELTCARNCGLSGLEVVFMGQCAARRTPTTSTTQRSSNVVTPSGGNSMNFAGCVRRCVVTADFKPICGSDGVTYQNPSRLLCVQGCGLDVQERWAGSCETGAPNVTERFFYPIMIGV